MTGLLLLLACAAAFATVALGLRALLALPAPASATTDTTDPYWGAVRGATSVNIHPKEGIMKPRKATKKPTKRKPAKRVTKAAARKRAVVNRSAESGQWVSDEFTASHPATTVTETVRRKRK